MSKSLVCGETWPRNCGIMYGSIRCGKKKNASAPIKTKLLLLVVENIFSYLFKGYFMPQGLCGIVPSVNVGLIWFVLFILCQLYCSGGHLVFVFKKLI